MLFQVGPLQIEVVPFNVDAVSESVSGDFVAKPVLGRRPPREAVGEGEEALTLAGKLFPFRLGGFSELEIAKDLARKQTPVFVFRGDGTSLGYFTVESVKADHGFLERNGVGREIAFTMELQRCDAPSEGDVFSNLMGLLP